jgi:hypothetical protein
MRRRKTFSRPRHRCCLCTLHHWRIRSPRLAPSVRPMARPIFGRGLRLTPADLKAAAVPALPGAAVLAVPALPAGRAAIALAAVALPAQPESPPTAGGPTLQSHDPVHVRPLRKPGVDRYPSSWYTAAHPVRRFTLDAAQSLESSECPLRALFSSASAAALYRYQLPSATTGGSISPAHGGRISPALAPHDTQAVLLSLCVTREENFTMDGRSDGGWSLRVSLAGCQPIRARQKNNGPPLATTKSPKGRSARKTG